MKIALTTKGEREKKKFKNLIMSVYEENRKMQKAPRETPPPPSSSLQM
jgi:hypothetical protein